MSCLTPTSGTAEAPRSDFRDGCSGVDEIADGETDADPVTPPGPADQVFAMMVSSLPPGVSRPADSRIRCRPGGPWRIP